MKHTIKQREVVYSGKAFKVEKVHLGLPDGREGLYDLVNHIGSVTILPLSQQGNILFVRQYRVGSESELLELPAGTLNPGERPAGMRETGDPGGNRDGSQGVHPAGGYIPCTGLRH